MRPLKASEINTLRDLALVIDNSVNRCPNSGFGVPYDPGRICPLVDEIISFFKGKLSYLGIDENFLNLTEPFVCTVYKNGCGIDDAVVNVALEMGEDK